MYVAKNSFLVTLDCSKWRKHPLIPTTDKWTLSRLQYIRTCTCMCWCVFAIQIRRHSKERNKTAIKTNNTLWTCTKCLFWSHYATHLAPTTHKLLVQKTIQLPSAMHNCSWQWQYSGSAGTCLSLKVACSWPGGSDSEWSVDSVTKVDHYEYGCCTSNILCNFIGNLICITKHFHLLIMNGTFIWMVCFSNSTMAQILLLEISYMSYFTATNLLTRNVESFFNVWYSN